MHNTASRGEWINNVNKIDNIGSFSLLDKKKKVQTWS